MIRSDQLWRRRENVQNYLEGTRAAIPFANEQIGLTLRLMEEIDGEISTILDLGCGDGVLGRAALEKWPQASCLFIDFSDPMLEAAERRLAGNGYNYELMKVDFAETGWTEAAAGKGPFDVVLSGFSIHHQPEDRKRALYFEIFNLLREGGAFLNMDNVSSPTPELERIFESYFVESVYRFHAKSGDEKSREAIMAEWAPRRNEDIKITSPLDLQLGWLRDAGFDNVDCYMKIFELALFGGVRPVKDG